MKRSISKQSLTHGTIEKNHREQSRSQHSNPRPPINFVIDPRNELGVQTTIIPIIY